MLSAAKHDKMSEPALDGTARRRMPPRTRSNFLARTATDDAEQLERRYSMLPLASTPEELPFSEVGVQHIQPETPREPLLGADDASRSRDEHRGFFQSLFSSSKSKTAERPGLKRSSSSHGKSPGRESKRNESKPRPGSFPRPVGGTSKLGTFAGVFVPTSLNVLSILMFLRFGFILGQTGVVGMMGMLNQKHVDCCLHTVCSTASGFNFFPPMCFSIPM